MPSPEVRVSRADPATLEVAGSLVFDNVVTALAPADALLRQRPHETLDLSAVTRVDSAGLACVLAILALARRDHSALVVRHAPADLLALAKVCEVSQFLEPAR